MDPSKEQPPLKDADSTERRTNAIDGRDTAFLELREERLAVEKQVREVGVVEVGTRTERFPDAVEATVGHEELDIERIPVDKIVSERIAPWQDGDALVVPVYEERLTVVKQLVMREQLRVRRVLVTEQQRFEDVLERDRLVINDSGHTGLVREHPPVARTQS